MIHGSTFVDQQMLQLLFNKCLTVCRVMLNVDERSWTKIETSSIPFNAFVQHCSTFVEQQMLQDVEPCIIGLRQLDYSLSFSKSQIVNSALNVSLTIY